MPENIKQMLIAREGSRYPQKLEEKNFRENRCLKWLVKIVLFLIINLFHAWQTQDLKSR